MIDSGMGRAVHLTCNMRCSDFMCIYIHISSQVYIMEFLLFLSYVLHRKTIDVICLGESLNDNGVL